jgi:hypothetical protein
MITTVEARHERAVASHSGIEARPGLPESEGAAVSRTDRQAMTRILVALVLWMVSVSAYGQSAPLADHHQHLFSPTVADAESVKPISVEDLVSRLDEAGIRRAAVLSLAYILGDPSGTSSNEYERVKAENDWTRSTSRAAFYVQHVYTC